MLVRRKTRPIARLGKSYSRHNASGFDVFSQKNIQIALRRRLSGDKMQRRIASDIRESDELERVFFLDRRGDFCQIAALIRLNFDARITRNIQRVVLREFENLIFN